MRYPTIAHMAAMMGLGIQFPHREPDNNPMTRKPKRGALPVLREQLAKAKPGTNRYNKIADRIRKNGGVV